MMRPILGARASRAQSIMPVSGSLSAGFRGRDARAPRRPDDGATPNIDPHSYLTLCIIRSWNALPAAPVEVLGMGSVRQSDSD